MGTIRQIQITLDGLDKWNKLYYKSSSKTNNVWTEVTENFTIEVETGVEDIYWFTADYNITYSTKPYIHYTKEDGTTSDYTGSQATETINGVATHGYRINWGASGGLITTATRVDNISVMANVKVMPQNEGATYKYKVDSVPMLSDFQEFPIGVYTEMPKGKTIEFRVYPKDGYMITERPYFVKSTGGTQRNFTLSDDGTYYYTSITSEYFGDSGNYIIATTTPTGTPKHKFTTTLENCTTNIDPSTEYEEGATVEVTVTANEGYYFSTVPTVGGVEMTTTETEKPQHYTLSVTMDSDKAIVASAISIPTPSHVWTFNVEGVTSIEYSTDYGNTYQPLTEDLTFNNQYLYIKLNFVEGTTFENAPTLVIYNSSMSEVKTITGTTQEGNNYYLFNVSNMFVASDYYYTINAQGIAPETYTVTVTTTNCSCSVSDGQSFVKGVDFTATLTPDSGYYFENAPRLVAHIQGADVYYNFVEGENGIWSLTVDGATTNLWSSVSGQNPSITANAQVIPSPSVTKYGFITLYKPSSDNLESLANVRFYKDISGNYIDLGQYISNVYRTFFTIPTSKSATLNLGGYSTDINTPVIENDTITLNCGSVEVTGKYNNVMDYNNTTIEIFLPFIGIVALDTSKCIGKTLTLTYIVNLVNGKGIVTLIDNDNIIVYNGSCECTFKIPYKVNQLDTIQGDISIESNYLLGFTPYIIIRRDKSIDTPTKSDIGTIALATYNGYIKGRLLNNTILATEKEKAEIESLFNSGVYI